MLVNSIFHFPPPDGLLHDARTCSRSAACPSSRPTRSRPRWRASSTTAAVADTYEPRAGAGRGGRRRARATDCAASRVETAARTARGPAPSARNVVPSPPATTTIPIASASPARSCRTSRTTDRRRTATTASTVVVVGGKNSAAIAALELYRAGATVTLVHRRAPLSRLRSSTGSGPTSRTASRRARSPRASRRAWCEIRPATRVVVDGRAAGGEIPADAVFLLTGLPPGRALLLRRRGARVDAGDARCPSTIREHAGDERRPASAWRGASSSGRETSRIFIENGRFHGEAIVRRSPVAAVSCTLDCAGREQPPNVGPRALSSSCLKKTKASVPGLGAARGRPRPRTSASA